VRLGLDARHVARGLGISVFVSELATRMARQPEIDVVWFGSPAEAPAAVAEVRPLRGWPYPALDSGLGRRLARDLELDVFHFTGNTGWPRGIGVPFVLTIHDLIFMNTDARKRRPRQVVGHRYARRNVKRASRNAARVATVSQATADEIGKTLVGVNPTVVHSGVSVPASVPRPDDAGTYVIAFGGRDPRKRLERAAEGWRKACLPDHRLKILAGAGVPDRFYARFGSELRQGRIELIGYVPRLEMWSLLIGADALIYPSCAEGFGLPVLEAMAVGVPCLAGSAPAVQEVGGDAIVPIDPESSADSIARGLRRVLDDSCYQRTIVGRGYERAGSFTWERTARAYAEIYQEVAG
jgi:glycosyltransferase involved in cell wall biosynthesis